MNNDEALDHLWKNQAVVIRAFLDVRPVFEKLTEEVAYILDKHLRSQNVEFAAITHRAKTLDSFCEKVVRKEYKHPLIEMTDIGGVRIVFLYPASGSKIEAVIKDQFEVIDKIDSTDKDDVDHFGYGAVHYLVKLGKKASGARYDELKGLVCEIQVRTVLQDAWAIVAHHLSYKKESDVPKKLRRKLNALSGLFETADDQFDQLGNEQQAYRAEVKKEMVKRTPDFLKEEINVENMTEYLNWRFPDRRRMTREDAADLLSGLAGHGYTHLNQIEDAVSASYEAIRAYETKYPPTEMHTNKKTIYSPVGVIRAALKFTDSKYFKSQETGDLWRKRILEFMPLVKGK